MKERDELEALLARLGSDALREFSFAGDPEFSFRPKT